MFKDNDLAAPVVAKGVLTTCRFVIAALLAEQVYHFATNSFDKTVFSSLNVILEPEWIKDIICGQLGVAAVLLALGVSSRLVALWAITVIIALTSFLFQNGAVLSEFVAARFLVFIAATSPILLFGGGSLSIRPTGWHVNRLPTIKLAES